MKFNQKKIGSLQMEKSLLNRYLSSYDWGIFLTMLFLLVNGLIFIYQIGAQNDFSHGRIFFYRQLFWIGLSLAVYLGFAHLDYRNFRVLSYPFYFLCLGLLVVVLVFGTKVFGAKRWLDLGFINLQPSELTKLAVVMLLALLLENYRKKINQLEVILYLGILVGVPFMLIFAEPDLGSALVLLPTSAAMIFAAGVSRKFIIVSSALAAGLLLIFTVNELTGFKPLLKKYHRARIEAFLRPESASSDMTYQQRQSEIAVGSGGMLGKGLGNGTQHALGFLPATAANNDFIFSVIAEEGGFLWCLVLISAFIFLVVRILFCSLNAADDFGKFMALGIGVIIFTHVFINIGVNIKLAPVTGLPLPFISYGGTFIMISLASLGIVQSINRYGKAEKDF